MTRSARAAALPRSRVRAAAAPLRAAAVAAALSVLGLHGAAAEVRVADVHEASELAAALSADGTTLVIDLLGGLWTLPVAGGAATPLLPAEERARQPRFSPDGEHLVYQREIGGRSDLWLFTRATGERRSLTTSIFDEREPDFSPDGRAVVFAGDLTGRYCLWSLDLETGALTQLTDEPGNASFPAVGPRGEIAYVVERAGRSSLRVRAPSGATAEVLDLEATITAPVWRPGGNVLVYGVREPSRGARLEMLILSEPAVRKAITGAEDVFASRPAWFSAGTILYAADGRLWRRELAVSQREPVLLFAAVALEAREPPRPIGLVPTARLAAVRGINGLTSDSTGRRTAFTALGDLWLAERNDLRRLTDDAFVERDPAFTPDGANLVFASDRAGQLDLWRIEIASGRVVPLTFGAGKSYAPAVSPDGRRVAFLETDGLGPWAPARLRVLQMANPTSVGTLVASAVPAGPPRWRDDGGLDWRVAAVTARASAAGRVTGAAGPTTLAFDAAGRPRSFDTASAAGAPRADDSRRRPPTIELEWQNAPAPAFVVAAGRLFDGAGTAYESDVDIHVAGGRIAAIVPRGSRPSSAPVIDASDATIIPGLIDVHAHQSSIAGERLGRAWLAFGVTTVRELSNDVGDAIERGEAWASGRSLGPRLVISSALGPGDQLAPLALPETEIASPALQAYPSIVDGLAHGLAARLGRPEPTGAGALPDLVAPLGHRELALSAGFAIYQDGLAELNASASALSTTLGALRGGTRSLSAPQAEAAYQALFDPAERSIWNAPGIAPQAIPGLSASVARLIRDGGRVAIGSDAPAVPYGLGVHTELATLAAAGVPPAQALRAATVEGALALGLEAQIGTIEPGKLADFVVVDGDPLARIEDALRIRAVVKGGIWLERERLLARP